MIDRNWPGGRWKNGRYIFWSDVSKGNTVICTYVKSISPSFHSSVRQFILQSVRPFIHPSVLSSVHPFIRPFFHSSVGCTIIGCTIIDCLATLNHFHSLIILPSLPDMAALVMWWKNTTISHIGTWRHSVVSVLSPVMTTWWSHYDHVMITWLSTIGTRPNSYQEPNVFHPWKCITYKWRANSKWNMIYIVV